VDRITGEYYWVIEVIDGDGSLFVAQWDDFGRGYWMLPGIEIGYERDRFQPVVRIERPKPMSV